MHSFVRELAELDVYIALNSVLGHVLAAGDTAEQHSPATRRTPQPPRRSCSYKTENKQITKTKPDGNTTCKAKPGKGVVPGGWREGGLAG